MDLSLIYFPSAVTLGALHALEPGHAKTLTAAYLIGTKGTKRDATILGLSVATTHSLVVVGLSIAAVMLGEKFFTEQATFYLSLGTSLSVIVLGLWFLSKRLRILRRINQAQSHQHQHDHHHHSDHHSHEHDHEHEHNHDHSLLSEDEHARAHAADLPEYVKRGERPTLFQVMAFGAVGGLMPCPAAVSVMLLALSLGQTGKGLLLVLGFSLGLALTLVGLGLLIVTGISKLASTERLSRFSSLAPSIAAGMVIFSGVIGLISVLASHS